jgi:hypothetical protein
VFVARVTAQSRTRRRRRRKMARGQTDRASRLTMHADYRYLQFTGPVRPSGIQLEFHSWALWTEDNDSRQSDVLGVIRTCLIAERRSEKRAVDE